MIINFGFVCESCATYCLPHCLRKCISTKGVTTQIKTHYLECNCTKQAPTILWTQISLKKEEKGNFVAWQLTHTQKKVLKGNRTAHPLSFQTHLTFYYIKKCLRLIPHCSFWQFILLTALKRGPIFMLLL